MDAFITAAGSLSQSLLPTAGLVVLLFLIGVLRQAIRLLQKLEKTLERTDSTFTLVDQSLSKIQDPLNTVSKISQGVDSAYDSSVKAVHSAKEYVIKNKQVMKDKVSEVIDKVKHSKKVETVREPSPEDILGGK